MNILKSLSQICSGMYWAARCQKQKILILPGKIFRTELTASWQILWATSFSGQPVLLFVSLKGPFQGSATLLKQISKPCRQLSLRKRKLKSLTKTFGSEKPFQKQLSLHVWGIGISQKRNPGKPAAKIRK